MNIDRAGGRLPITLLAYAVALALFLLVPPFLRGIVGPPAGFTQQEAADLLTPIVVIPLAWLVLEAAGGLRGVGRLAFLVIAAVWIEGQGIHLAANAIGDAFPKGGAEAFYVTPPGDLDLWLDEVLSHWMWHVAWVALTLLIAWVGLGARVRVERSGAWLVGLAALVHGVVFFFVTVEGVTTTLGLPACAGLLAWAGWGLRDGAGDRPVLRFIAESSAVTIGGYLGWAAANAWALPEFSKVGLFG